MKKIAAIVLMILLYTAYDAVSQGSSVIVFSAKGEKFILEVNGTRQNSEPQARVTADGIGGPMVKMKVYFEEPGLPPVSKSAMNKINAEFIYVLEKDAKGKYTLQSSATDWSSKVEGQSEGQAVKTETAGKSDQVKADKENKETEKAEKENGKEGKSEKKARCDSPISEADFYSSTAAISHAPFDPPKLSNAKNLSRTKCLSADQVRQVIYIFDGEKTKLDFAKYAYEYVFDPENYDDVNDALREKSVQELKRYIEGLK